MAHRNQEYAGNPQASESRPMVGTPPTVFRPRYSNLNEFDLPTANAQRVDGLLSSVPYAERPSGVARMASPQSLCRSVFGGLKAMEQIDALKGIKAEDGLPAFFDSTEDAPGAEWELTVDTLNEPRPPYFDAYLSGPHRVGVEVQFADARFDTPSRPHLAVPNSTLQNGRYWDYAPQLFHGSVDADAPLRQPAPTSRFVRNLVAVSLNPDGSLETDNAHLLVIYDDRNPSFFPGEAADTQWQQTFAALRFPHMLRRLSWQHLAGHLALHEPLGWLVDALRRRHGIIGQL